MNFRRRLETRYSVRAEGEEPESDTQPGSSHPDNWQTDIQSGKSPEQIRQDAVSLSAILQDWQGRVLDAQDYYKELSANSDKYLHMYGPILIKGLSREKLEAVAEICRKFARLATIV
jgi:hypothetical protein